MKKNKLSFAHDSKSSLTEQKCLKCSENSFFPYPFSTRKYEAFSIVFTLFIEYKKILRNKEGKVACKEEG